MRKPKGKSATTKLRQRLSKTNYWVLAILTAAILVLVLNIYVAQTKRAFTSDDVVTQVMVHDHIATGGKGTLWFGEDNFVIKIPFYQLGDLLIANSRKVIIATVVLLDVAGFILFFYAALYFLKRFKVSGKISLLILVWLATIYNLVFYCLMNPNLRNVEIGISFVVLMLFAKYLDGDFVFKTRWQKFLLVVLAGLLGMFFYSDPFYMYMLAGPLILFLLAQIIWLRFNQRIGRALVFVFASLISSFVWLKFFKIFFHFSLKHSETSFAAFNSLGTTIPQYIFDYFHLLTADFWGRQVFSPVGVQTSLNALLLICTTGMIIYMLVRRVSKKTDPWLTFFLAMPIYIGAIFIFSQNTVLSGYGSVRFLVMSPFYIVFAMAIFFAELKNIMLKRLLTLVLCLSIILNVGWLLVSVVRHPAANPNAANFAIVDAIKQNHFDKGYAHYWDGNINEYLSNYSTKIVRVECFTKIDWLMDQGNESVHADKTFYIYDKQYSAKCSPDDINEKLGEPSKTIPINDQITIFTYDYDIGAKFNEMKL